MKKVLVTGADGFIGSHLTEMLLDKGYHVRALSYYNSFNNCGWLEGVTNPRLEIVPGDIRDPHFCKQVTLGMDIIFHLAALISIPYSYIAPDSFVDTNVKGTLNICQAAKENSIKRILITSTSEVYGTALYVPIDEMHPKQPQSPYSASKIAADAIALSFYFSFGLPVVIVRPFNTYGPRQSARAIIPAIISQIAAGKREIDLGDVTPTRDFNYVEDICKGFIELSGCEEAIGQEVNISSKTEHSMREIFEIITELMSSDAVITETKERLRPQKSEVFRLCGDNRKITSLTGYIPEYDVEKGLLETINWFQSKENLKLYKPDIYNV
jgi:NAD dependent epimerase/dehydratase